MKILIIHTYDQEENEFPSFGGTRLISYQRKVLEKLGYCAESLSIHEIRGLISLFSKLLSKLRRTKVMEKVYVEKNRWLLNLLYILFIHFLNKFDLGFSRSFKKCLNNKSPDAILCNYPTLAEGISKIAHQFNMPVLLYEHNIEWEFFNHILNKNHFTGLLIQLLKNIELTAAKKVEQVICVADEDKEILVREGIPSNKVDVWIPFLLEKAGAKFCKEKKDTFTVGFIGSNFEPNIKSVKSILKTARKLQKIGLNVHLLIMGSVKKAFEDHDIPENVTFTGFVKDLDSCLELCDVFINPKSTSDAGIEIKMLDYLKAGKPIITTKLGARGFPLKHLESCIIENDVSKYDYWIAKLIEDVKLRSKMVGNINEFVNIFIRDTRNIFYEITRKIGSNLTQDETWEGGCERIDPFTDKRYGFLIKYEHINKYEIALSTIKKLANLSKSVKILDLGCGFGYGSRILTQNNITYFGCDVSFDALLTAKKRYNLKNLIVADAHYMPFKCSLFDAIIFLGAVEHIKSPDKATVEIARCLKRNGLLFISTPNREYLPRKIYNRVLKIAGKNVSIYSNPFHLREYSLNEFKKFLESLKDFEILEVRGQNIFPPIVGDFILSITQKRLHKYLINLGKFVSSQARDFIATLEKR